MRKRIAAGLLAFALAFTAMDFGGLVSIQANAAGLVQVTEENQSNFHLNGDYAGYYAIADKEDLQAFADGILDHEEGWLHLLDARNETSHIYDEATATTVFGDIRTVYDPLLKNLIQKLGTK